MVILRATRGPQTTVTFMTTPQNTNAVPTVPTSSASTQNTSTSNQSNQTASVGYELDDSHWAPPRLTAVDTRSVSKEASWDPAQISKLQALMDIHGFEAAYLVNSAESTYSTIVGNRSSVTKAQIATICASLQVGDFEQLTLSLDHIHILARHSPHLPNHACVMVIDRTVSNAALAMNSLKQFCDELG